MTTKQSSTRQLTFTDELIRRKKQRQERCKHNFIYVPIAYDQKLDEVYETVVCLKCGYSPED